MSNQGYPQQPGMMQQGMPGVQQGMPGMQQGMPGMQPGMQGQPGAYAGGQPVGYSGGQVGGMNQPGMSQMGPSGMNQPGMQGVYGKPGYPSQPGMSQMGPGGMQSGGYPGMGQYGQPGMGGQPGMMGQQGMYGQPGMMSQQSGMMGPTNSVFTTPTTFQVTRNFFAMGGEMDILMNGAPHFRCISCPSPLGYGYCFNLVDMNRQQLCYIQPDQSYSSPHFNIFVRGMLYATLKQDWNSSEKKFELHNKQTGEQLKVYGDWFGQNFEFQRHHGGQVAQVTGGYGDSYNVMISPGEDALFVLAAVLCIEKACHEHKHHHKHNW